MHHVYSDDLKLLCLNDNLGNHRKSKDFVRILSPTSIFTAFQCPDASKIACSASPIQTHHWFYFSQRHPWMSQIDLCIARPIAYSQELCNLTWETKRFLVESQLSFLIHDISHINSQANCIFHTWTSMVTTRRPILFA